MRSHEPRSAIRSALFANLQLSLILAGLLVFLTGGTASAAPNSWDSGADMPTPRHALSAATALDTVYAMGGTQSGVPGTGMDVVEQYDPLTDQWTNCGDPDPGNSCPPMPTARRDFALVNSGGKLYALGGDTGGFSQYLTVLEEYDPALNVWTNCGQAHPANACAQLPTPRGTHTASVVDGKIYVIGGRGGSEFYSTVEEYDPLTNTWTNCGDPAPGNACPSMQSNRIYLTSAVVDGKIYVIGGRELPSGTLATDLVEEFDPAANEWTNCGIPAPGNGCARMPTARLAPAAVAVNGKIYVAGGDDYPQDFAIVEEYDPGTNTWTNCGAPAPDSGCALMPAEKHDASASVVDGLGYFLGGTLQNVIGGTTNVNWIYTPPEGDPCGNGIVDAGEECDDGNAVDGDGCSADCILEPDSDGDGVADFADNCPDDSNEDQEDRDGDEIGDVCDPFPDEPDNDQAQCEADLTQALADLDQCLIDPPLADEDGDGEADATDQCPATVEFAEVDAAGCSQDQFCDQFGAGTIWQIVRCVFSDWGNDEPTRRVPRDCRVSWWPRSCVSW